ncbi:hypothetical protein [Halobiforma nitratireducens]|uniref:Uncharacterized protein n=1 Tax=Halobiforma nitratireducens JCM 10879 TaxID=1227454 RepID=M0ML20_9EURY|nr:hypothetical protein [Halobiforma nitratireducens]EMA45130.1 hypothetical protein C446_02557 [Halobiforma nitratireducens JCM 10879]
MSDAEIEDVDQQLLFEDVETGERITKLDAAAGVDIPAVGEKITLADVEFEDTSNLVSALEKGDREYVVRDINRQFARATHTEPDPPTVFQFSIIRVLVAECERDEQ